METFPAVRRMVRDDMLSLMPAPLPQYAFRARSLHRVGDQLLFSYVRKG